MQDASLGLGILPAGLILYCLWGFGTICLMPDYSWSPPRRIPYLDGLRAYSIAAVVIGHAKPFIPWFSSRAAIPVNVLIGGRFGVRVFFVISGFLITTLLLKEFHEDGRISLSGFYERRIARIFPAFYTYLLIIIALTLLHAVDLHWPALLTAATYTWNYGHLWGAPTTVAGEVLGHFWTVSLEEQFYLVWPACLIFFGTRWAERLAVACVMSFPLIRLISYFLFPGTRGQLNMMFHTGSDQILWGAVTAFACQRGAIDRVSKLKWGAAIPWVCGLIVFVLCPVLEAKVRGTAVILNPSLECGSVALLILWLLSAQGGPLRWILESWPMVQLGLLSYSLYVWQAIFILWEGLFFIPLPLRILGALVFAIGSYRLIEIPMRKHIRGWFAQSEPAH
jgi:peptidoglycan/LPS O-acetylase OafA/YrhL